jgi:transposase
MGQRRKFTNEFKLEAVRLAERGDVPVSQVARDLDLHETVLRRWMGLYGKRAGAQRITPEEHEELIRLRRENRRLTMERDILKKAVGIFSKELP